MELNNENVKKIIKIVAFGIILLFCLQNLEIIGNILSTIIGVLSPFLIGIVIAFVLNIPMSAIERKMFKPRKNKNGQIKQSRMKRPVSIILSCVFILLIIGFVIKLVIPQLISVIIMFAKNIPDFVYNLKEWAINLTGQYPDLSNQIKSINIDWNQITSDLTNFAKNLAGNLVSSSFQIISSVIGGIFNTIISVVFAIYILMSKEKLVEQAKKVIKAYCSEKKEKYILEICKLSNNTFSNFAIGQCTEAVILGCLCFIGMLILKLPYAATIAVLIGVTALIPVVGAFIGAIIGAILILSVSWVQALIFVVFLIILQQIETNLIYPKVVGNSVGLPGIWVLLAVLIGGSLGGVWGLLIGLPTISVLYTILKNDVNEKLNKKI